jgi:MerR family transcriptional regulator, light-induced transcriptional regulator
MNMPEFENTLGQHQGLRIAEVERDTGIGKDTLRVWERRYGFPIPERDASGERVYPMAQVERLRIIRRLMDQGVRPGKIIAQDLSELLKMLDTFGSKNADPDAYVFCNAMLKLLRLHRSQDLRANLNRILVKEGLQRFISHTVVPMNNVVGDSWLRGELSIPEEHLYTEQVQNIIRHAIQLQPATSQLPRILLTTFPNEEHGLGILMVEAMCAAEGAQCTSLGTRLPLSDIASYAISGDFDVVAVSFSAAYPARDAIKDLKQFRQILNPRILIWAGGSGLPLKKGQMEGVKLMADIGGVSSLVADWRRQFVNEAQA